MVPDMVGVHGSLAERLLIEVRAAHEALIAHAQAAEPVRRGLSAVYEALAAGLSGMTEQQILATPTPDEWSMAEVVEHVAEHDRAYVEFERLGVDHYVEHGIEHALQLWRLRTAADAAGAHHPAEPYLTPRPPLRVGEG